MSQYPNSRSVWLVSYLALAITASGFLAYIVLEGETLFDIFFGSDYLVGLGLFLGISILVLLSTWLSEHYDSRWRRAWYIFPLPTLIPMVYGIYVANTAKCSGWCIIPPGTVLFLVSLWAGGIILVSYLLTRFLRTHNGVFTAAILILEKVALVSALAILVYFTLLDIAITRGMNMCAHPIFTHSVSPSRQRDCWISAAQTLTSVNQCPQEPHDSHIACTEAYLDYEYTMLQKQNLPYPEAVVASCEERLRVLPNSGTSEIFCEKTWSDIADADAGYQSCIWKEVRQMDVTGGKCRQERVSALCAMMKSDSAEKRCVYQLSRQGMFE
jgi:hypothetical protein